MWIVTRLRVGNNQVFLGAGSRELLEKIEEHSSIKKATRAMGLSYTKALRIIRTMEAELGFPVVVSEKGGNNHGGTKLTEKGRHVLEVYMEIEREVTRYAQKLLDEKFNF